ASAAGPSRSGAWWGEGCSCVAFGGGRYRCSGCANCTESRAIGGAQQDARRQAAPTVARLFAVSALRLGFWGGKCKQSDRMLGQRPRCFLRAAAFLRCWAKAAPPPGFALRDDAGVDRA